MFSDRLRACSFKKWSEKGSAAAEPFATVDGEAAAAQNLDDLQANGSVQLLYLLRRRQV